MSENWSPTFTARIEKKYRIWIPKVIRELLDIREGDIVEVRIRVHERRKLLR